jgi:hypothetical protein
MRGILVEQFRWIIIKGVGVIVLNEAAQREPVGSVRTLTKWSSRTVNAKRFETLTTPFVGEDSNAKMAKLACS